MKIPPVKGTRDFYPQDMVLRNWITDGWKDISIRNGFEEYDGPIFEYLKMYQIKSGDEIAEQLFSLQDRGGRDLAIRPEITPTLARMVNQQVNSLPRPIKWFSVPRLCRAERPQKGRFREFFQWNIDILGVDDVLADAEVIFTTVDYLRSIKLGPKDVRAKISSRKLLAATLRNIGLTEEQLIPVYAMLDKYRKIPKEALEQMLLELTGNTEIVTNIMNYMASPSLLEVSRIAGSNEEIENAVQDLACLKDLLERMGVWDYCEFDPSIVRGLAYYTGIVFEVHAEDLRAICGGGRYDNLLRDFGGPPLSATGMGMGDCVLEILLREKGLLDEQLPKHSLDFFVVCADEQYKNQSVGLTMKLRSAGKSANFSYKAAKLGKQMKEASDMNAITCIIVGEEIKDGKIAVKDKATGDQQLEEIDRFLSNL